MLTDSELTDAYRDFGYIEGLLEKESIPDPIRIKINNSLSRILALMDYGFDYHKDEKPKKDKCK